MVRVLVIWPWNESRTKRFHREVEVVKDLNLKLYEGEHFSIGGQSGPGKYSISYILSWLSSCTSGEAYIYGLPLEAERVELKSIVCVFPKGDICSGMLTPCEELEYIGTIKGKPWDLINSGRKKNSVKL